MTVQDDIAIGLDRLLAPGTVFELRIPATRRGTISGYFDDAQALAACAAPWDGKANIYVTLNPAEPALLARSANRLTEYAKHTTGDRDIVARRWLPIDCDPARPAGISSTEAQHATALRKAAAIRDWLTARGWPEPLTLDSGNGGHLLYRVELPADDGGLTSRVLQALAFHFDDNATTVDQGNGNAARIWKVPGTRAVKGDSTPERPHRRARILEGPATPSLVPLEALDAVAGGRSFDLDRWIAEHNLDVRNESAWQTGRKWVLNVCPWDAEHTDHSAYVLQFASGAIAAGYHHNGCQGKGWHELRDTVEPGWRERRTPGGPTLRLVGEAEVPRPEPAPSTAPTWPAPPADAAFHGLAGAIVEALDPTTEADPVAVLLTTLAAVGNAVGAGPHWAVSGKPHGLRIYPILVGTTSKGRKGTSWGSLRPFLQEAVPDWLGRCVASGLSSGEGLIWQVRDPIAKTEAVRDGGKRSGAITSYEQVVIDEGVEDKRLLVIEEEFASTLKVMGREANILSAVIRQAWDDGNLRTLTKNTPAKATDAHITVMGHITKDELLRYLENTEAANGFANRFLWACVRRSKILPHGGTLAPGVLTRLGEQLRETLTEAADYGLLRRDAEADRLWERIYEPLSEGGAGLFGAVTSRAEAQVMRLAAIYAVLDRSQAILAVHLRAAVALWGYLEDSARFVFGDALGDPIADTILKTLRAGGEFSQRDLFDLFGRNISAARLDKALGTLLVAGKVRRESREAGERGGRPATIWHAA